MKRTGFTLIELVVALVLFGLLAVLLADALRVGTRTARAVDERAARAHDAYVVLQFLAGELERAQRITGGPRTLSVAGGPQSFTVEAREGSLRLLQAGEATVLAQGLDAVRFRYLGRAGWQDAWEDERALPRLVVIRLEPGGARVAAPMLEVPEEPR